MHYFRRLRALSSLALALIGPHVAAQSTGTPPAAPPATAPLPLDIAGHRLLEDGSHFRREAEEIERHRMSTDLPRIMAAYTGRDGQMPPSTYGLIQPSNYLWVVHVKDREWQADLTHSCPGRGSKLLWAHEERRNLDLRLKAVAQSLIARYGPPTEIRFLRLYTDRPIFYYMYWASDPLMRITDMEWKALAEEEALRGSTALFPGGGLLAAIHVNGTVFDEAVASNIELDLGVRGRDAVQKMCMNDEISKAQAAAAQAVHF